MTATSQLEQSGDTRKELRFSPNDTFKENKHFYVSDIRSEVWYSRNSLIRIKYENKRDLENEQNNQKPNNAGTCTRGLEIISGGDVRKKLIELIKMDVLLEQKKTKR
mmetsp:Transcript_16562/g.22707  ORF Transcript_16562/g.22707 Transcript_16562/m.22707 type:complete len:107 (-) Transcript_16562:1-321(-)